MERHESSTVANTDLWSKYFQDEWSRFLNPLGLPPASPVNQIAEGTAARVASFLTFVAAGPIAWLYTSNDTRTPQVQTIERDDEDETAELELVLAESAA